MTIRFGLRANVERAALSIFDVAHHFLAVGAEQANRIAELFGVGERVGRLGLEHERNRLEIGIARQPPELTKKRDVPARARRLVDADLERVRALGQARAAITRERRAQVEARAVASADAASPKMPPPSTVAVPTPTSSPAVAV